MKKQKDFELKTTTDIKVFILFIMDNIGYPLEHDTIIKIVQENTDDITFEYDECLTQLAKSEHLLFDEVDGVRYYTPSIAVTLVSPARVKIEWRGPKNSHTLLPSVMLVILGEFINASLSI